MNECHLCPSSVAFFPLRVLRMCVLLLTDFVSAESNGFLLLDFLCSRFSVTGRQPILVLKYTARPPEIEGYEIIFCPLYTGFHAAMFLSFVYTSTLLVT